jgi:thiamine pyrophosphokinase
MGICLIVGASPEPFWDGRAVPDTVLCADGGLDGALNLGLKPDVWIGDADSSAPPSGIMKVTLPAEKDCTDVEACLLFGLERGMDTFFLLGCTGGRLDHFLGNIGLLELLHMRGARGVILNRNNEISYCGAPAEFFPPHRYRYISILPLDSVIEGVCVSGVKYPLENAVLSRAGTYSVSNEPCPAETARISVGKGKALIIRSDLVQSVEKPASLGFFDKRDSALRSLSR